MSTRNLPGDKERMAHKADNLTAICEPIVKSAVFWDVILCEQPSAQAGSSLADFFTLKMEGIRSSETSVHTKSTWRHIPEDGILHNHRRENLNSYMWADCLENVGASTSHNPMGVHGLLQG
jgi:hypothetical protein